MIFLQSLRRRWSGNKSSEAGLANSLWHIANGKETIALVFFIDYHPDMIPAERLAIRPDYFLSSPEGLAMTLHTRIQKVRDNILRPVRWNRSRTPRASVLFEIIGGNHDAVIETGRGRAWMEAEATQEIAFDVMKMFGFDEKEVATSMGSTGVFARVEDGTVSESLEYPSQSTPGLIFVRHRSYYGDSGQTFHVRWDVVDNGPNFRFDLKSKLLGREPTPVFPAALNPRP